MIYKKKYNGEGEFFFMGLLNIFFDVEADNLIDYLVNLPKKLDTNMYNSLISAGLTVKDKTTPYVPLDKGYLEDSYEQRIYTQSSSISLDLGYHVKSNPYSRGYDYSYVQHEREDFHHPKRGTAKYLDKGIRDSKEKVYDLIEEGYYKTIK